MKVYVKAATQISLQEPLSENWLDTPVVIEEQYKRSTDPNFRDWLNPLQSRRMGKILRRALVTALKAMADSGIACPNAIITGTGLGCIENTELILDQLCREGEQTLKPTYFMQSTHNTISSLIAIHTHCHGYNCTYSHRGLSFDAALFDAFLQLRLGDIATALVTGNDELTPSYYDILKRIGYVGREGQVPASETSGAVMLAADDSEGALAEIESVNLGYGEMRVDTLPKDIDAVLLGVNGDQNYDAAYDAVKSQYRDVPMLHYKHLFGENYSASTMAVYAAAHILARGEAPSMMRLDGGETPVRVNRMLIVTHSNDKNHSTVVMRAINND